MEHLKNKKISLIYLLPLLTWVLINSCQQREVNDEAKIKQKFYRILSKDDELLSYNYREYLFDRDTITEKCTTISLAGKVKNRYMKKFLKREFKLYLLDINNNLEKSLYFSITKKDTCYRVNQKFDKFKICFNGLVSNKEYKDAYKISYEEMAYDGNIESLILDKDFTLISRFCENNTEKKEVLVDDSVVPEIVKISVKK